MTTTPAAKAYQRGKDRFFYISLVLNILVLVVFAASGLSVRLEAWAKHFTSQPYSINAIYFSIFYWGLFIFFLPLHFFQEFIWEHKFDLSNQKFIVWFADHLKQTALGFLLAIVSVEVGYILLAHFPQTWWIWAGVFWLFLTLVLARIMPNVIIPLFYKYSQIKDENLRTRILGIFEQCELPVKDVYLIDLSRKTKKANAFICGLGVSRRIVLSDTLASHYTVPEIEAVVAHEIGHHKHKDIWRFIALNTVTTFLGFFLINKLLGYALIRLNLSRIDDIAFFPVLVLGMMAFNFLVMPFVNAFSRRREVLADWFSLNVTKDPEGFISMMKKLGAQNFAEFEPHWFKELLFYDHPSIAKRLRFAAKWPAV